MRVLSVLSLLIFCSLSFGQTPAEIAAKAASLKAAEIIAEQSKPGPWPKELPFPDGLVRYTRAEWTQEIAVTNGSDRITPVHRSRLKAKWHQSGGMEGISGYRSDIYKMVPVPPKVYVGNIQVWNGSNHQPNRGWKREYPSGTMFVDALSKDGEPFEIRQRVKEDNGKWRSSVIYVNEAARPKGYAGLKQSCSSCHSEAGSGGYATGLVPGGDETLSDPFVALER